MNFKVGQLVELFRNSSLIQQCKITELSTIESTKGTRHELYVDYGDGFGERFYVDNGVWTTQRSGFHTGHDPDPGYEPDVYEHKVEDKYLPQKSGVLKRKHKHVTYYSYKATQAYHQEYEKWRKAYNKKNNRWPYGADDFAKIHELKKKHFGV